MEVLEANDGRVARAEAQRRGGRVSGYLLRVIGEEKKGLNREWTRMDAKGGVARAEAQRRGGRVRAYLLEVIGGKREESQVSKSKVGSRRD
jgi:hypothetical protein